VVSPSDMMDGRVGTNLSNHSIQIPLVMHLVAAMIISLFLLISTYLSLISSLENQFYKNRNYD